MEECGLNVSHDDILGLMVKINDEAVGEVNETVEKGITNRDAVLLSDGASVADASMLPATPGAPPILAIVALAKYVSKIILARN